MYAAAEEYQVSADAKEFLERTAEQIIRGRDQNFSNARLVRKVFERTRMKQALRTSDNTINAEDIREVLDEGDMQALLKRESKKIGFAG